MIGTGYGHQLRRVRERHGLTQQELADKLVELAWVLLWEEVEAGRPAEAPLPPLPKTIDFTTDYLRSGLPRDAYARAQVTRSGRRYASVRVEAWQDNRARPIAQASGHFLMPERDGVSGGG